jgi:hypothetical protein
MQPPLTKINRTTMGVKQVQICIRSYTRQQWETEHETAFDIHITHEDLRIVYTPRWRSI